ncbi:MAG: 50S ribosomal protein L19e [Promethearchaeota archaeon]
MDLKSQRRIAAEILKCGVNRVWMDPAMEDEIIMAITRDDIRQLIKQGIIKKRPEKGISRSRAKVRHERKKRGHGVGPGKRKGKKTARTPKKKAWIQRIRPQRRLLKKLRDRKMIERSVYRKLYLQAKGGAFNSVAHLLRHLEEKKLYRRI